MVNVDVVQLVAATPNEISEILLDHQQLDRFFDAKFSLAKQPDEGEVAGGKGAIRNVTIAGVTFAEQVLSANAKHISYAIIGDRPLRNHQGNIYLVEQSPSLTRVRYTIICQGPKWLPEKLVAFLLAQGVKKALIKLNQFFLSMAN